jgi:hypothetical protein
MGAHRSVQAHGAHDTTFDARAFAGARKGAHPQRHSFTPAWTRRPPGWRSPTTCRSSIRPVIPWRRGSDRERAGPPLALSRDGAKPSSDTTPTRRMRVREGPTHHARTDCRERAQSSTCGQFRGLEASAGPGEGGAPDVARGARRGAKGTRRTLTRWRHARCSRTPHARRLLWPQESPPLGPSCHALRAGQDGADRGQVRHALRHQGASQRRGPAQLAAKARRWQEHGQPHAGVARAARPRQTNRGAGHDRRRKLVQLTTRGRWRIAFAHRNLTLSGWAPLALDSALGTASGVERWCDQGACITVTAAIDGLLNRIRRAFLDRATLHYFCDPDDFDDPWEDVLDADAERGPSQPDTSVP